MKRILMFGLKLEFQKWVNKNKHICYPVFSKY